LYYLKNFIIRALVLDNNEEFPWHFPMKFSIPCSSKPLMRRTVS